MRLVTLAGALLFLTGATMAEWKPLPLVESTPPSGLRSVESTGPTNPDEHPDTPYIPSDSFKKFLRNAEGTVIDPVTQLHMPYQTEGDGLWHVGIGHLIGDGKQGPGRFAGGISENESDQIFASDIVEHRARARSGSGAAKFDKLDQHRQEILTEIAFNTGSLEKFPDFTQAVLDNKMHMAGMQHHRNGNERRNELMANFMGVEYVDEKFAKQVLKLQKRAQGSERQNTNG
jgi:hypothetical protein